MDVVMNTFLVLQERKIDWLLRDKAMSSFEWDKKVRRQNDLRVGLLALKHCL